VIPLNTPQTLPPRAFWYLGLKSLIVAVLALGVARLFQLGANSGHATCHGALCGTITGSHIAGFIYVFAAFLAIRALVNFKSLSFVLTDKNISISSGVLFRNSCTIRFDRIQDVRLMRDPLHLILGLRSVAIWTASPDQRVGNAKRPDGLLVLETDEADWLKEYLSDPAQAGRQEMAAGGAAGGGAAPSRLVGPARGHASMGIGAVAAIGVIVIAAMAVLWHGTSSPVTAPPAAAAPVSADSPSPSPSAEAADNTAVPSHPHVAATSPVTPASNTQFALTCALHPENRVGTMAACAELGEARRCQQESAYPSQPTQAPAVFTVANRSHEAVKFFWLDLSGARSLYASLPPGGHVDQQTHLGAHWLVSTGDGRCVGIFNAATMAIGIY
jgi:membrane protein YdbS with pleckstrin-like domain